MQTLAADRGFVGHFRGFLTIFNFSSSFFRVLQAYFVSSFFRITFRMGMDSSSPLRGKLNVGRILNMFPATATNAPRWDRESQSRFGLRSDVKITIHDIQ